MSPVAPTERSLADLLLQDRTLPTVAHLVAVAIVFLLVRGTLPNQVFIPWAAAIGAVVAARAIVWERLAARASPPPAVVRTVRATIGALGLAWGLGAGVAVQIIPPATQAFLLLTLAGLLSGSGSSLTADRWVVTVYAICMFAPTLIGVALVARDNTGVVAILLVLIFVGFTLRLHARAHALLLQRLQTERQLAAAQEIANIGSWEWNTETNTVTWSDQMRLIFGLPLDAPASFAGYLDRVHPDDRSRIQATIAASLAERRPMAYDWRTIRPDGEERLIHTRNMLVTDASGRVLRMLGIALDITERTRAQQALADSERYHRALVEQSLDLTTLVDADGFVRYASPSNETVLGYPPGALVGRRVFELVHPDDLEQTLGVFSDGSSTPGAVRRLEFRFRHRDGSWRILSAVGRNLFDDPIIKAGIINARDVTQQKAAEEHERTLLHELQQAMSEVKVLKGILPICASCKRIRNDDGGWEGIESFVRERTDAEFSHGLCPDCAARDWGTSPRSA